MSGNIRGKIEMVFETASGKEQDDPQEFFKGLYDFFSSHPNATIIALQYGNGTSPGTDYWDGANPFGTNAWFVFRMETTGSRSFPYYGLIQWTSNESLQNSPGGPGLVDNDNHAFDGAVGVAFAIGVGGDENPWAGGMNFDGSDLKNDPVWADPAASVTSGNTEPFALADQDTLTLTVDGGTGQTITFDAAQFSDITNATAAEVAAEINNELTGGTAFPTPSGAVIIRSATRGSASSITVTGGTGNTALNFSTSTQNGGSAVHVFPRSNNSGGNHATSRENMIALFSINSTAVERTRAHIVADDDNIAWAVNIFESSQEYDYTGYCGLYTPRPGISITYPMVVFNRIRSEDVLIGQTDGDPAEGGILTTGSTVQSFAKDRFQNINSVNLQPGFGGLFDMFPIAVYTKEPPAGFAGRVHFVKEAWGLHQHALTAGRSEIAVSDSTNDNRTKTSIIMPWDESTTPKSGSDRTGIDFNRAP